MRITEQVSPRYLVGLHGTVVGGAWSPNDDRIFFQRAMPVPGTTFRRNQLWWVIPDGTAEQILVPASEPTGSTLFPDVGVLRVKTD